MNKIFLVVLSLGLMSCATNHSVKNVASQGDKQISIELSTAIKMSETEGTELFEKYTSLNGTEKPSSREAELMLMLKEQMCKGDYQPIAIIREEKKLESIYFLLMPDRDTGVQFGRHFRMDFKLGTNDIDSLELSTKGCILIPSNEKKGSNAVALFITHLLTEAPTEFHVFLSLYHKKTVFVSTSQGLWKVEQGKIVRTKSA